MRTGYLAGILLLVITGISSLFWYHELKYQLPTPVPQGYNDVKPGTPLALSSVFGTNPDKPLFLHFFNPDCPCSRFNTKHFKSLVKTYGKEVEFVIVALVPGQPTTAQEIRDKFDLDIPVSFDSTLTARCGVYATPQAVIIDKDKLYFRGNYNKSRYCTDPASNYAQMALDSLLLRTGSLTLNPVAFKAYGCELPVCKK
ncbi:AhpC/TSA family protein [Flavisolibacter sp. BT320]|nr:AhpC/TSA family protein [Flavisolibacter longurius]